MAGIDPGSDGLELARRLGVATTHEGLDGLRTMPGYGDVGIVFDATSAAAHARHAQVLAADGKRAIDLTPAAVGPYAVPAVNLDEHIDAPNPNMVTCRGPDTTPIVTPTAPAAPVRYAAILHPLAPDSPPPPPPP